MIYLPGTGNRGAPGALTIGQYDREEHASQMCVSHFGYREPEHDSARHDTNSMCRLAS